MQSNLLQKLKFRIVTPVKIKQCQQIRNYNKSKKRIHIYIYMHVNSFNYIHHSISLTSFTQSPFKVMN